MANVAHSHITSFLGAGNVLGDAELAVAIQGMVAQRPAVRDVLLNVWRAEEASCPRGASRPGSPSLLPTATIEINVGNLSSAQPAIPPRLAVGVDAAGGSASAVCSVAHEAVSGSAGVRRAALDLAAACGAKTVNSQHVLAVATMMFPAEAARVFGDKLCSQLVSLIEKSGLMLPHQGDCAPTKSSMSGDLGFDVDIKALFAVLDRDVEIGSSGPSALFAAIQKLPDTSEASQLLKTAKVFLEQSSA